MAIGTKVCRRSGRASQLRVSFFLNLMVDKSRIPKVTPPPSRWVLPRLLATFFFGLVSLACQLGAQTPSAAAYPATPTASAGMTSGIPGASGYEQAQMAQIRTAAQNAQGQAAAASIARSADQALENQRVQRLLQSAREIKFLKSDIAERSKWERSNQAQINKVSSNDMSSWESTAGNVKVKRDVPDPFLEAMIELEGREKPPKKERKGFSGLNPFKKAKPDPVAANQFINDPLPGLTTPALQSVATGSSSRYVGTNADSVGKRGGFFGGLKIPKIGNKTPQAEKLGYNSGEPQFVGSSSSGLANTMVPGRSGQSLIDGSGENDGAVSIDEPAPTEKKGFFSGFKKAKPQPTSVLSGSRASVKAPSSRSGDGFFGFSRNKSDNTIDAGLFPDGAVDRVPAGSNRSGGYTADDHAPDTSFASSSTGEIVMPGEDPKKRNRFNLSMPEISFPSGSFANAKPVSGQGSGSVPTLTTINSAGTEYYIVTSTAQFMVYGNDQMSSEVRALGSGSLVRMTKPGEQWASIQLPDGSEGVVQNKFLRAASAAESSGQFVAPAGE